MLQVLVKIDELLDMLIENPELTIGEQVTEETESLEKTPYLVRGCVLTIVDRMDEEFIKLLKVRFYLTGFVHTGTSLFAQSISGGCSNDE